MKNFRAFRIHDNEGRIEAGFETLSLNQLTDGEVVVAVDWSGINYKDALAATGKGRILRKPALNGGIDLAGRVIQSSDRRFREGDEILVCGAGLSEILDGGYSQIARIPASAAVALPGGLTLREAMALGTAGFTAAIAVQRMEDNGQKPEFGPILVTGATGGVGSFAIDMLKSLGYSVVALTGKAEEQAAYLHALGADSILDRHTIEMSRKPLERMQWGGAVDNVGGETLAWLTRTTAVWGNIASVGLAGGHKLETTVMPFILRGVSLLGINSVECPPYVRANAWSRVATDLKPSHLALIANREIAFDELPQAFDGYVDGRVTGRTVVRIGSGAQ
ncbi:MAG: acryloyl-CoA reductase [Gammaproteobacteria bacterium]|nr:acryloyl-CoA reductase [Gammaproteobacteria bacterium]